MVAPINYAIDVASPFEQSIRGFALGQGMAQAQAQQQAQTDLVRQQAFLAEQKALAEQRAMQRSVDYQNALMRVLDNPNRTWKDWEPVLAMAPNKEQIDAIKVMGEQGNARKLQSQKSFASNVLLSLEVNPEVTKTILDEQIAAEQDPQQQQFLKTIRQAVDISPQTAAQATELGGAAIFGKDWYDGITKVRAERRAAALAPFTLRKETADTIIKEAEAKFAPDKFLASLNLTQEQIEQAKATRRAQEAAAAASGAEARRKEAESQQIGAGVIPLDKRFDAESKFRSEYNNLTKGYQEVKSAYGRVLASEDSAVGDLALIFSYMKMLDPGSVVREGEFATAQNAAGVPERVRNIYNRVISGERLTASQRESFKGQANGLFKQAGQQENTVRTGIERIARGYGLNTANIFLEPVESAPTAPTPTKPQQAPASGQRNVTVNY